MVIIVTHHQQVQGKYFEVLNGKETHREWHLLSAHHRLSAFLCNHCWAYSAFHPHSVCPELQALEQAFVPDIGG